MKKEVLKRVDKNLRNRSSLMTWARLLEKKSCCIR